MRPLNLWLVFFGVYLGVMSPATTRATVLVPASFSEMVAEAAIIAHGRVVSVVPQWGEGRRRIESVVTLEVQDVLKGASRSEIALVTPGGELGAYRSVMIGAPVFAPGDEVVLFLGARPPALPYILGLNQGVFRIVADPDSGAKSIMSPVLSSGDAVAGRVVRGDPSRRRLSVRQFAAEVRRVLDMPAALVPGRGRR